MKLSHLIALLTVAATPATLGAAAETAPETASSGARKNLARQHLGSKLFAYDSGSQTYITTEAAAAWLDDDVTTAWPPQTGKSYYMLELSEPQLMTNFEISAKNSEGTVSIFAGDEPVKPGAESWKPVARDMSIASINEAGMKNSFSRFAKYLLIETDTANPQPWYSVYVYGNRDAASYSMEKRSEKIDAGKTFGPYLNDQTTFSYTSLYAGSEAGSQRNAIDDNPETSVNLPAGEALPIAFGQTRSVDRVAVLADASAKGRLDLFLPEGAASAAPDLKEASPVATLVFDGSSDRSSIEFPTAKADSLVARWTPDDGSQPLTVREINSFGNASVETYAVNAAPEAIAELTADAEMAYNDTTPADTTYDYSYDGKEVADYSDGKQVLDYADSKKTLMDPIAEFLPSKAPFVPGNLGFPPKLPPNEIPLSN